MEALDWYNWNAHRNYPLESTVYTNAGDPLPTDLILDMGVVFPACAQFDPDVHRVALRVLLHTSTLSYFQFEFSSYLGTKFFYVDYVGYGQVDATPDGSVLPLRSTSGAYGFFVFGSMESLNAVLPPDDVFILFDVSGAARPKVEPRCVQSLYESAVTQVSMYYMGPTNWAPPDEIASPQAYVTESSGTSGLLTFADGYNLAVTINEYTNALEFNAGVGLGEGEFCDWSSVAGLPLCGDVIATINGIPGTSDGIFTLEAGAGMSVDVDPDDEHGLMLQLGGVDDLFCGD